MFSCDETDVDSPQDILPVLAQAVDIRFEDPGKAKVLVAGLQLTTVD